MSSTFTITIRHRTVAVIFLSAVSMLGCYVWWGRLSLNNGSSNKLLHYAFHSSADLETPPAFLFQSSWVSEDDDEYEKGDAIIEGERIRGQDDYKKKKPKETNAAQSIDASLETESDAAYSWEHYESRPEMVWLMSYPNSGTSYTMMMVARASNRATASNYGKEVGDPGLANTPLYPGQWNGPFYRPDPRKPLPDDYILVKTHCGGRCVTCGPEKYVTNATEFLSECTRGSGFFPRRKLEESTDESSSSSLSTSTSSDQANEMQLVHYDPDLVKKAIHLYRNPFHNVVSRFHLERKHWVASKKKYEVNRYPNNAKGFQQWCKDLNRLYGPTPTSKQHILEPDIVQLMQPVPCHGEMYKYVQWHNLAYAVTTHVKKPTLIVHYENYDKKWNTTAASILDFLHLDMVGEKRPFSARHDYDPYFTSSQRNATKALMQRVASEPVWRQIARYFD